MMIWPAQRLRDATRYIVGLRNLVNNQGQPIIPSSAFAALRDNIPTQNPAIESRRDHYNTSVFPPLAQLGFVRNTLQLAWDFTTMTTHTLTNRMLSMRDDAFARTAEGIKYEIVESQDNPSAAIARRIKGYMTVPWYLTQVSALRRMCCVVCLGAFDLLSLLFLVLLSTHSSWRLLSLFFPPSPAFSLHSTLSQLVSSRDLLKLHSCIRDTVQVEPGVSVRVLTPPDDPNTALYNGQHEVLILLRNSRGILDFPHLSLSPILSHPALTPCRYRSPC